MKRSRSFASAAVLSAAFFISSSALAGGNQHASDSQHDQQAGKQAKSGMMDAQKIRNTAVLNELHHVNQKEIEMAKLAQEKAQSQQVKDFAQTILQDHQRASQQVEKYAQSNNVELAKFQPSGYEQALMQDLRKLSGNDFDRAFIEISRMGHNQTLEELQSIQKNLDDKQLKQLVSNDMIPVIRQHHQKGMKLDVKKQKAGQASSESQPQDQQAGMSEEQTPSDDQQSGQMEESHDQQSSSDQY